ncbi:MAG: hypothetical protein OXC92_03555 [Flavobacteriaceae bacterium]|nr:hypothetical protein [Flavobacteriaceae bacterium]MCY4216046.1 hypothetical protein [Flavobacteriaceae bacterium]MCY4266846.1 hypothetical protein [Flavobacteriaceae bacterium]
MAPDRKEDQELQAEESHHEEKQEDSPNADYEAHWFQKGKIQVMGTSGISSQRRKA